MKNEEITDLIIKAFYNVYNKLGFGFLEKVYEKAMQIEMHDLGLNSEAQKPIKVFYNEQKIGEYFADILIENKVIIELKINKEGISKQNEAQLLNYLRATDIEVGLILNFGKKPEFKRKVFDNEIKK
jgi:GxxExxY protein